MYTRGRRSRDQGGNDHDREGKERKGSGMRGWLERGGRG